MSQRIRRSKDRKNEVSGSTMATGGHVVSYSRNEEPNVRTPQKTTGDVTGEKLIGIAKASPLFKKLEEIVPKTKSEENKAIAESSQVVDTSDKKNDSKK